MLIPFLASRAPTRASSPGLLRSPNRSTVSVVYVKPPLLKVARTVDAGEATRRTQEHSLFSQTLMAAILTLARPRMRHSRASVPGLLSNATQNWVALAMSDSLGIDVLQLEVADLDLKICAIERMRAMRPMVAALYVIPSKRLRQLKAHRCSGRELARSHQR